MNAFVDLNIVNIKCENENHIDSIFDNHLFIYTEHDVVVIVDSDVFTLNKDKILVLKENQKITIESKEKDYYLLQCNGSVIEDIFKFDNVSNKVSLVNLINIKEKVKGLYFEFKNSNKVTLNLIGLFYQLLYDIEISLKGSKNSYSPYINAAIKFIKQNYNKDITVADVAFYCDVHPNYLSKLFQEEFSKSTKSFIIDFKMEQAAKLLKTKAYSVSQVSKKVGFKNQLHFSNSFKKRYGISPTKYMLDC